MRTYIHVYIPAAKEGMCIQVPVKGLENTLRQFRVWVEEHNKFDPNTEISISVWGRGEYRTTSSIADFDGDIEEVADVITEQVVR